MEIQIVNPIDYPGWDDILLATPGYTFFHSSAWSKIISESYQYTPKYFTIFGHGKFLALLPVMEVRSFLTGHRGVSLPFTDYCEPLLSEEVKFQAIYDYVVGYGREANWKFVEIRGGQSFFSNRLPSNSYFGHTLSLSGDVDKLFSSFKDNVRRNIKKAIKEGVEVRISNSLASIKEFYRLNCLTRKEHGLPPQPYYFFNKLHDTIYSNSGFVTLAFHNGQCIAGAIYFHLGDKAIYKYGASEKKYQHLRANNLVMWEAIKWYCKNGYASLCFGRTDTGHQGLRQFKAGWGAKEYAINYYKYDLKSNVFVINRPAVGAFSNKVFSKMPLSLLNIFGSLLYRHMG